LPSRTSLVSKMNIVLLLVGLFAAIDSRAEARTWFAAGNAIEMADAKRGLTTSSGVEQCLDIAKTCSMFADGDICANEKARARLAMDQYLALSSAEREFSQSLYRAAAEDTTELGMCREPDVCYHLLRALLTTAKVRICKASAEADVKFNRWLQRLG